MYIIFIKHQWQLKSNLFIFIRTGLPHGQEKSGNQEKSGKTKKNDKSQVKMGGI